MSDDVIRQALTCVGCGDSLRGFSFDATCPSCETPTRDSLRRYVVDPRQRADARRFQRGIFLLTWAGFAAWAASFEAIFNSAMHASGWPFGARVAASIALTSAPIALLAFGLDAATRRTRTGSGREDDVSARRARIAGWVALGITVLWGSLVGSRLSFAVWGTLCVLCLLACAAALTMSVPRIYASLVTLGLPRAAKRLLWCSRLTGVACVAGAAAYLIKMAWRGDGWNYDDGGFALYVYVATRLVFFLGVLVGTVLIASVNFPLRKRFRRVR